jgi:predicted small metal-binding protein
MKEFYCGAVVPDCSTRFRGETEDAILEQVAQHARADHGMDEVPDDVVGQVRANIHDVDEAR